MPRITVFALLVLASFGCGPAQAGDAGRGLDLARDLCSRCHVVDEDGGGSDAVPTFRMIANQPTTTRGRINAVVLAPHPEMPRFALTQREIEDLAAYILSLQE